MKNIKNKLSLINILLVLIKKVYYFQRYKILKARERLNADG